MSELRGRIRVSQSDVRRVHNEAGYGGISGEREGFSIFWFKNDQGQICQQLKTMYRVRQSDVRRVHNEM